MMIAQMTAKHITISLGLMITLFLAGWTTFLSYHRETVAIEKLASLPDAIMEDVIAIILDKQGKPTMKVITPKLVHYTENDTTNLNTPELILYRKSPQPWYVTSKYAKATQGIENVDFWDNVIIHHAADQTNPATVIKTATLTVHPNQQTADTADFITMLQPNLVVKATGMHADMNTGDIKLLSNTRGEYVPSS